MMSLSCLANQPELEHEVGYEVVAGPDVGVAGAFSDRATVGRSPSATISLTDPRIERMHLEITLVGDSIHVRDLTLSRAIRVGSLSFDQCVLESDGDGVLAIGGTRLRLFARRPRQRDSSIVELGGFERVFGTSAVMRARYPMLKQIAPTQLPVLIEGETGTGKSLLARTIHDNGSLYGAPFVTLDCGTVAEGPEGVRQVFGEESASGHVEGLLESASGGTFVFENVSLLPMTLQSMLLRVLDRHEIIPLHGSARRIDVRVICTTCVDLRTPIAQRTFREDLYFRIAMVRVLMPSLRERFEDLNSLIDQFLAEVQGDRDRRMSDEAAELLSVCSFPGNIRELRAVVHSLAMTARGDTIEPIDVIAGASGTAVGVASSGGGILPFKEAKQRVVDAFEKAYLERLAALAESSSGALELTQLTPGALRSLRQRVSGS